MKKEIVVAVVTTLLTIISSVVIAYATQVWIPILKSESAQEVIQESASKAVEDQLTKVETKFKTYPLLKSNKPTHQDLGNWQICTLVRSGTIHFNQACSCRLENSKKTNEPNDWKIFVDLDPNVDGTCVCQAACYNLYIPEQAAKFQ